MTWTLTDTKVIKNDERELFSMLDRGIDDMEAGRELSVDEAFRRISELREIRRLARV